MEIERPGKLCVFGSQMSQAEIGEYVREARRIEEDSLYSSKGHYNASEYWQNVHYWTGIPNCIIAAIAGLSAFNGYPIAAGVLAVLAAAITATITFLNPEAKSASHNSAAVEYHALRNRARIFANITINAGLDDEALNRRFEELALQRENLNTVSPQIPEKAFLKARAGIEAGEADHKE